MASIAAREVAREVLATIGRGKRPVVAKIAMEKGYTELTAYSGEVQKTATYRKAISPYVEKLEKTRAKMLDALSKKDMSKERVHTLVSALSSVTHDIQLLTGKATSNTEHTEDKRVLIAVLDTLRNGSTKPLLDNN